MISPNATLHLVLPIQMLLSQASNLGALARGQYRISTSVGEDRKMDYFFKEINSMSFAILSNELNFRILDHFYFLPKATKLLELHQLRAHYPDPATGPAVRNYQSIEDIPGLVKRFTGSLVDNKSAHLLPDSYQTLAGEHADPTLLQHLRRKLNIWEYLEALAEQKKMTLAESKGLKQVFSAFYRRLDGLSGSQKTELLGETGLKELMAEAKQALGGSVEHLKPYLKEGLESRKTLEALSKLRDSTFMPKMALAVLGGFFLNGSLITYLDNNVIQPWQRRLVKKYGEVNFTLKPGYLAYLPTITTYMLAKRFTPGYLRSQVVASLAAVGVYALSAKGLLSMWMKNKPEKPLPSSDKTIVSQGLPSQIPARPSPTNTEALKPYGRPTFQQWSAPLQPMPPMNAFYSPQPPTLQPPPVVMNRWAYLA